MLLSLISMEALLCHALLSIFRVSTKVALCLSRLLVPWLDSSTQAVEQWVLDGKTNVLRALASWMHLCCWHTGCLHKGHCWKCGWSRWTSGCTVPYENSGVFDYCFAEILTWNQNISWKKYLIQILWFL
jgi:hypothetical protein